MSIKREIIDNLQFLISSAKERDSEQGIKTFTSYINKLAESNNDNKICKELYHELSGMQRFADFNSKEWEAVQAIFNTIESDS
jgi:hypothetical protein